MTRSATLLVDSTLSGSDSDDADDPKNERAAGNPVQAKKIEKDEKEEQQLNVMGNTQKMKKEEERARNPGEGFSNVRSQVIVCSRFSSELTFANCVQCRST